MGALRNNAWLLLLLALLTGAVMVLAQLQYRWIDDISRTEADHLRGSITFAARRFSEEFTREVVMVMQRFRESDGTASDLFRRGNDVAASGSHAIASIELVDVAQEVPLSRLDATGRLVPVTDPQDVQRARALVLGRSASRMSLLFPLRDEEEISPRRMVIVNLDRAWLVDQFFPRLARRYFNADLGDRYDIAVVAGGEVVYRSDPGWPVGNDRRADVSLPMMPMRREFAGRAIEERLPVSAWSILVRRHAGPLQEIIDAARRRNLVISFGMLLLLAGTAAILAVLLRRAERMRTQQMEFVAGITHELNTPLAALDSAGQNLADGIIHSDEQVRRYGDLIVRESRRLTGMVAQVLEFAGLQQRKPAARREPVDVASMIDEAVAATAWLAESRGIRIERSVDAGTVAGDRAQLVRALQNLLMNGIRYGGDGKWIGVRADARNGSVIISVEDRGPGIAARDLPHLFEPFYRGAGSDRVRGNGLGLAIVRKIVEAHGGSVTAARRRDCGAQFTIELPAHA